MFLQKVVLIINEIYARKKWERTFETPRSLYFPANKSDQGSCYTIKFKSIFSGLTCNSLIFYFSGLLLFYLADSRKIKTKFQRHFGRSLTRTVKLLNLLAHRLPARHWLLNCPNKMTRADQEGCSTRKKSVL